MNQLTPLNPLTADCNGVDFTRINIGNYMLTDGRKRLLSIVLTLLFFTGTAFIGALTAQSSTCVPDAVQNSGTDPWSEECYLNDDCDLQGNPCQANDVNLLGVFIADSVGGPVPACMVGEDVTVLLWGTFLNGTNAARYAVRTRTEIFIDGTFLVELKGCSFDVLLPGETNVALLGTFNYTCGAQVQLVNTWIGWSTTQAQCSDPVQPNYNDVCGEYPPSKCSRDLDTISFLTVNFDYSCGLITSTTTEVCFTDLTIGGTPPYTYLWEFGDNTTSTLQNPCHTYIGTTGSYTVTLTVTDSDSIEAGAILTVNLDSLNCCDMTVICPTANGGLFECVDDIPVPNPGLVMVTDSCGPVTITFADDTTGTGCGTDTMFVVRSYFITDGSNFDTCLQTFVAVDDIGPVLTGCPGDINVECANLVPAQSLDGIDATDNCGGNIILSLLPDVVSDSTCANRYVITRTYVATDECGNSTTCDQLITVFDDTLPVFSFVPLDTLISCDAIPVFGVPVVTDNCGGAIALDSVTTAFTTVNCAGGTILRVWTATDACANSNSADQLITLIDTISPTFTFVPADTAIACDETAVFGIPIVTDNCDISVSITQVVTTAPTVNCAGGTTTIVWTATDNCGNTATADQVITFIDTIAPVFTFVPADSMILCDEDPVFGIPQVTDNCDLQVAITADTVTLPGLCGDTITVTWTATDNCANSSTADQTFFQVDTVAPMLSCPANVTLECADSTLPNATVPGQATATDNCDITPMVTYVDVTVASQTCPQEYTITRTWTASDDCGNSTACVQTITVDDSTPPVLTCPVAITIECTDSTLPDSTGIAIAVDNCDLSPEVSFTDVTLEGNCPQAYLIQRTWLAVDTCGNDTTCVQLISITDSTGPVITCPADTIVDCMAAVDTSALGVATATDNCGGTVDISFTDATIAGGCEQEYTINRTWLAVDECLNRTTCVQVIMVQDTVGPVFDSTLCPTVFDFYTSEGSTCPLESVPSILLNVALGIPLAIDETWTVGNNIIPSFVGCLTDNCADPDSFYILASSFTQSGDSCDVTMTVTFAIADNCGNSIGADIEFTITIHDDVAPVITCPLNVTVDCDASTSPDSTGFATAIDDCIGLIGITYEDSTAMGSCPNEMLIFRTWTADDSCGNTSSCTQLIFVVDDTAPVMLCPPSITVECTDSTHPDSTGYPLVFDACDLTPEVDYTDVTIASLACPLEYSIIRSWTSIDTCGNISTCVQNIFVQDNTPPVLTCPDNVTIDCTDSTSPDSTGIATAVDSCDLSPEVTFLDATIAGLCPQEFSIIRVWSAIDTCGNISTCTQLISVVDTVGPVLTCPADVTVDCTASTAPTSIVPGMATAVDNCDPEPIVTAFDVTAAGSCLQEYTITRTWIATDACLNTSTCVQIITVQDTLAPVITCPADTIIDCTSITLPGSTGRATAVDNCDLSVLPTFDDVTIAGNCPQEYTIMRTWTAIDDCLNESTCVQTISVQDTLSPILACPADTIIDCTSGIMPDVTGMAIATDNCDTLVTPTFADVTMAGLCPQGYTILRTWTAVDDCLNEATCVQTISVQDTLDPVLICPADTIIDCSESTLVANTGMATATDNCDTLVLINSVDVIIPSTICPTGYTILRTWTAVDDCLNRTTCLQTIIVQDTTAPVIVCLVDMTVSCETDVPACPVSFDEFEALAGVSVTDLCDTTLSYSCSTGPLVGGVCGGTITRTHTVTDDCGNSATCIQTFTVDDNIPPMITCPANVTIQIGGGEFIPAIDFGILTDFALFTAAGAFDNLGLSIVSGDIGTHVGTITGFPPGVVIGQMHTANGVTAQAAADVAVAYGQLSGMTCGTVLGTTLGNGQVLTPDIYCLGAASTVNLNLVLDAQGDPNAVFIFQIDGALSTNALSNVILINGASSCNVYWQVNGAFAAGTNSIFRGNLFVEGAISLNFGAELEGRALSTAGAISTNANVVNSIAPCSSGETGMATATDNCGSPLITYSDTIMGGACCGEVIITRTWIATDSCLNASTCTQIIVVQDTIGPVLACPADTIIDCTSGTMPDVTGMAMATDNCDSLAIITSVDVVIPSTICPTAYTILRTWTAVDDCLNSSTCVQTIIVQDTTAPVIVCPVDTIIDCTSDISPDLLGVATVTDNCDATVVPTFADVTIGGQCPQSYIITRTWTAVDSCFNSSTCVQIITVQDTLAPVIVCPADTIVDCTASTSPDVLGVATATDNCDLMVVPTFIDATIAGECPQEYTITRTWTAIDDCFNSSTCVQTIMVQDTIAPVIVCPADTIIDCTSDISPDSNGFATATDNCDLEIIPTFEDVTVAGACPQEFTITRTWTAIDDCLNSSTCVQTILVQDTLAPVITCPANLTLECTDSTSPDSTGFALATDNCDGTPEVTYLDATVAGACPQEYTITRTWTAIDSCGNSSTCDQVINVADNTPPVITCPDNITIDCDVSTLPDSTGFATALDNCDESPEVTYEDFTFSTENCVQEYFISRLWTATDSCGNFSSCFQSIFVQDTTPPVATFIPPDVTVECDTNIQLILAELPIFEDNCDTLVPAFGSVEVIQNPDCPYTSTFIIAWSGVDDCGNSTTVGRTVTVIDTTGPVITCPEDVTIDCLDDTSPEGNGFASAVDNCDPEPLITSADVTLAGECPQEYTITRTWTAADACGNSNTCVQTINVVDTLAPTIICPADLTLQCVSQVAPPDIMTVLAFDSCGITTVTFVADVVSDSTCVNRLTINRVYQAADECGNTSTCTQIISVFDNTPPAITCPANVTVQCAAQVPPANIASVITTDNCGQTPVVTHVGDAITNMTCANRFTLTRTYRSTDACGNSATCAQVITVFDNTPPMITCPANVTVQCASQVPAVNIASVTATDNCAGTTTITHVSDVVTNMTCVNRFILTRTYRATDACGNSATCAQVITVFDNTPPTLTCPANLTVQCANQVPAPNTALVTSSDNCGGVVTVTFVSDVITNMTCINRFTLTRTYRATDACGNSATCTQVITVFDNTAPTITFTNPDLQNGGTLEVQCYGQDPEWMLPEFGPGSVSTMDNCAGNVTVVVTDDLVDEGDCDVDGYINRYRFVWTATDACGNSSTAFIFMNLVDTIPPVITNIPSDVTVNCNEIPEPPTNIMATDECLCACIILFEESGPTPGCQDGQVITRTWIAEDDCGNITVEVQHITLVDDEGPVIVVEFPELAGVENGTIFEYTCNEGGIPDFWNDLNAESVSSEVICGTAGVITFTPNTFIANNCKFWGYIENRTYTWEGVDDCGNVTTFTLIARLVDTEGPQFINMPEMTCVDDPILNQIDIIDNCENAKFTYWDTPIPNPCGDGQAFRRTYEAWDDCGNYERDTVILIPNDQSHPLMEFINPELADIGFGEILLVECADNGNGQYTPYGPEDVSVMDACMEEVQVIFTERIISTGDCRETGIAAVMQLTWMAMDVCGNRSQLTINAHLIDNTNPEFVNFEVDVTIDCNDDMPEIFAVDNCGEVVITTVDSIIPGACEFEYDVLRRITATDPCGNTTTRLQIVRVGDGQGPIIEGVEEEVCDDLSIPEVTAFDPCAGQFVGVSMQEDTLDVPCRDGFVLERIWTAVDACGNTSEIRQHIIIGDLTPPEILIPSGSVIRLFDFFGPNLIDLSNESVFERLELLDAHSVKVNDDCDQEITADFTLVTTVSENCEEDGYYEHRVYTWIATDACGNSDAFSFEVDIMDDVDPLISGVPKDTTVICEDLPPAAIVIAEDWAEPVTLEYTEEIFPADAPGAYLVIRTWTATDPCGNVAQSIQYITWIPTTITACDILLPESVDCNSHDVVIGSSVSGGLGELTYMWEITGEKCFIQSGQNTPEITIYVGWSEVEISLTVTDAYGCVSVCTAVLDCLDPIVADFTAQQDPTQPVVIDGPVAKGSNEDNMLDILQHFTMWPNPAAATVSISFESMIEHDTRIVLTNYLGQAVFEKDVTAIKGLNSHKLNVAHLPEGSYVVQLISERAMETKVLVLVRNK